MDDFFKIDELYPEVRDMVLFDTNSVTPESDVYIGCNHTALGEGMHYVDERCNCITRYFEDCKYARAYALESYENGICIICNKKNNTYTILVLGEDDGQWFISEYHAITWIKSKNSFMSLLFEAISVFNANYHSKIED